MQGSVNRSREILLARQTGRVHVAMMTMPWAPVVMDLALAAVPSDDVLIVETKRMREH